MATNQLTPKGIEEKARIALRFLRHKQHEYDVLKAEIDRLQLEVENNAAESVARRSSRPV